MKADEHSHRGPGRPDGNNEASDFCSDFLDHPVTAVRTKTVVVTSINTVTVATTAGEN